MVGAYVNSHGYVHQTVTMFNLEASSRLIIEGRNPTVADSWFPGYGWRITYCGRCANHLGWLFTATHKATTTATDPEGSPVPPTPPTPPQIYYHHMLPPPPVPPNPGDLPPYSFNPVRGTYEATANHFQNALTPTGNFFWGIRRSALIEVEEGSSAEGRAAPSGGGIIGKCINMNTVCVFVCTYL
jgi:hypothetical protein